MNAKTPARTESILGRAVAAEARARIAAQRLSDKLMAERMGVSQNYLSKRLRDVAPFTLDDVDMFVHCLDQDEEVLDFIAAAYKRNLDRLINEDIAQAMQSNVSEQGDSLPDEWSLAADRSDEESEQ